MEKITETTRDVAAAVQAGRESAAATERVATIDVLGQSIPVGVNGSSVYVLADALQHAEKLSPAPHRRKLSLTFSEAESFVEYVKRYKQTDCSVIYADIAMKRLTCVFDDFVAGGVAGLGGAARRGASTGPRIRARSRPSGRSSRACPRSR